MIFLVAHALVLQATCPSSAPREGRSAGRLTRTSLESPLVQTAVTS